MSWDDNAGVCRHSKYPALKMSAVLAREIPPSPLRNSSRLTLREAYSPFTFLANVANHRKTGQVESGTVGRRAAMKGSLENALFDPKINDNWHMQFCERA